MRALAQGDGEISGTGLETLMSATLRFGVIKDTIITGPRAIVRRPTRPSSPCRPTCSTRATTSRPGPVRT